MADGQTAGKPHGCGKDLASCMVLCVFFIGREFVLRETPQKGAGRAKL
jgi:hypothetical protein